jgi:beta-mannan synthase
VACPNELPPTMSAYKTQQYRWNSGPMVVVKSLLRRIWTTDRVGLIDRISCTYFFIRWVTVMGCYMGATAVLCTCSQHKATRTLGGGNEGRAMRVD